MRVEVNLLGTLEATVAGVSIVPSATKPSQCLALLAINAGHIVTAATLIDELWGQHAPRRALSTLQTYIMQVRRRLQNAIDDNGQRTPKDILITKRVGYALEVEPDDVDAVRYERLAAAGRRAANDGDYLTASRKLAGALELWRGPALVDVPTGPQLGIEATRLEESRLSDLGLRIEADLRLGRHHQLLSELATLCARHRLVENFWAQYMLALYRSGRQWRALQVYREIRDTLVEQLGIEPTPRLQRLHHAMLSGDSALDEVSDGRGPVWAPDSRQVVALS
ncbi:MAG TPA: AfsR/SARP family transcriptional regulator [Actinophytocola sp.]|uniref:AfsR/SARP family transcriptional regulator n=1 Tax=Actinophytocola sp. TaxID=1872138 RepID=UPI002DBEF79C|nr:AfsR/SARP family transcriptional regulator [Actinophytocola sp.]HEU5473406.1 AfsR/SARP family transcriptional regulator [Actinophytocola sp.]